MNREPEPSKDENAAPDIEERPWIVLKSTYDVEAWIDQYNWDLRRYDLKPNASGYGICFILTAGGEVYMHTTPEGEIVLDVTPEAEWAGPVITAATGTAAPAGRIWRLPPDRATQLVYGLNSLIAASRPVLQHDFRIRKF